jgi:hypothetical protein
LAAKNKQKDHSAFLSKLKQFPRSGGMKKKRKKKKKKKKPALHKIEFSFYAEGGCFSGGYCLAMVTVHNGISSMGVSILICYCSIRFNYVVSF